MARSTLFASLFAVAASLIQAGSAYGQAPDFDANQAEVSAGEVVRLEDQLMNGLRVVTPEQRAYINQIVALVNQGRLPRAMVNVVYNWAIQRNPKVPLPYFQFALHALAERRGVAVPPPNIVIAQ